MINFLNAVSILELQHTAPGEIDAALVKKSRRHLLARLELDGKNELRVDDKDFSISDVELAIDELGYREAKNALHLIAQDSGLENFLTLGDTTLFSRALPEAYYSEEFTAWAGRFFVSKFDPAILKAYMVAEGDLFERMITFRAPVSGLEKGLELNSLLGMIRANVRELAGSIQDIESDVPGAKKTKNVTELFVKAKHSLPFHRINRLPAEYTDLINETALKFDHLSVAAINTVKNAKIAHEISQYTLHFAVDETNREHILKNNAIIWKSLVKTRSSGPLPAGRVVWIILVCVSTVLRLSHCSSNIHSQTLHAPERVIFSPHFTK